MTLDTTAAKKYDKDQLKQLKLGLEHGVDINLFSNPEFMALQMEWIRMGLEKKIDVSLYADPQYDWFQMEEIYMGLVDSIDVSKYLDPEIPYDRMREIRQGLMQGIDLSPFGNYGAGELRELRLALRDNVKIVKYMLEGYDEEQLAVIREALTAGIDIDRYLSKEYRGIALNEIVLGLKKNLKVETYANTNYSWQQMREIREGLEERLDTDKYSNVLYNASQMHEIRLGLEAGLDVSSYRSLMYTAKDMKKMRHSIIEKITSGGAVPMIPGEDGYNEYLFDREKSGDICFLSDGSVDYKQSFRYASCRKNDVIAIYHNATDGMNGFTAEGQVIRAVKGKEKRILSGKGVYYNEKTREYRASIAGWIHLNEDEDLLEIREAGTVESINSVSGRMVLSGNLEVLGNIEAGSNLELDGDLIVDGHVEEANIKCTGNIFIRGGANGNENFRLETSKSLICMYIENCRVRAGKDIYANYILSSELSAGGRVCALGNRGNIIGSRVLAQTGIICKKAGNEAKVLTRLYITFPEDDRKIESELNLERQKVSDELEVITKTRDSFKQRYNAEERNNRSDFIKLEKAVYTKNLELREIETKLRTLEEKIESKSNSKIIVTETVYAGVLFAIDKCKFLSEDKQGKTFFEVINGKMTITRG